MDIPKPPGLKVLELQWKPDMDCVSADELMKPTRDSTAEQQMLEKMYVMCAVEMREQLRVANCAKPHFERYRSWLAAEYERFKKPGLPLVPNSAEIVAMSSEARHKAIVECHECGKGTHMWPVVEAAWRVYINMIDIVEGRLKLLKVLMEDRLLPRFYDWANELTNLHPLFNVMGHCKPQLRVLEIGAGTGGTTARALDGLKSDYGERLYSSYIFTDISDRFFAPAQQRFRTCEGIEYRQLDISRDPRGQGFKAGAYDLVIASNVLHATPCLVETLTNCRALLQPNGYLFMQELSPPGKYINYIVGLFPGWWLGGDDGRPDGPYVSPIEWDRRLRQAGFEGLHSVGFDNEPPYYYNANMLAQPVANVGKGSRITLLTQSESLNTFAQSVRNALIYGGYLVEQQTWGSSLPKEQDVVSLIDFDRSTPLLQDVCPEDLAYFIRIMEDMTGVSLLWVMPSAQISCDNPHYGQILGVARSIRAELGVDFATLELETTENQETAASVVTQVLRKLKRARTMVGDSDLDTEYIWAAGHVLIGRFQPFRTIIPSAEMVPTSDSESLTIAHRGIDRIMVRIAEENTHPFTLSSPTLSFKADVSYLLVGSLGALDRAIISWMAAAGARDLIILSQSAGISTADQVFVEDMKKVECLLHCLIGDVADRDVVQRVIGQTKKPIAGVVQMAMAPKDVHFMSMDHKSWSKAGRSQIQGTWNLHNLLPKFLDFFVLFSFNSGTTGSLGQSNNTSANSFLNAFLQYRHGLGLPASVINFCAVVDVGFMMQKSSGMTCQIEGSWGTYNSERELLYSLQLALARSAPQYITPPVVTNPIQGYRSPSVVALINCLERSVFDSQKDTI